MDHERATRLADFVGWCEQHITGDEKSQAHIFLDRFFRAFGHDGLLEAGGQAEVRIRKAREDGGGTAFADCVWKPHVLIEMKKRGEDLSRHYRQAFDYWTRLVPGRPHYVILCNFDELWIYDFDIQLDTPVDQVRTADLPTRYGPLAFLFPTHEAPVFGNDNERVTRDAAARLAVLFNKLKVRNDVGREQAQRFVLQLLVALFAEDIGLLERYTIQRLVDDCHSPESAYDLFGGLFEAMNEPGERTGGRFKGVRYFNGGIFSQPAHAELHEDELAQIREAANQNWAKVRPEIFGTIFEQTCDQDERHAYGAHFTSAGDIMKIVRPTITEPWEQLISRATTVGQLEQLHYRMQNYRVLDPACGSGNFLYLAYRELKRIESHLFERLAKISRRTHQSGRLGFVTTKQFFGMDINPFAVELAKVTMMLGHKLAIDELHSDEDALPLDNLDDNIRCVDALLTPHDSPWATPAEHRNGHVPTAWPEADVIIGNPPFLGAKRLKPERGSDYVNAVRKLYPNVPGMADYCVYWFRRAHDHLPECTPATPVVGRAGLVGTQNIRNNKSREGGLDHITATGTIVEAVENQPWSGEASVHVSIANWVKHTDPPKRAAGLLIPEKKKLWFRVEPLPGSQKRRKRGQGSAAKVYELDFRETEEINAALSDKTDVTGAIVLKCNTNPKVVFQGITPGHSGFVLKPSEAVRMRRIDPTATDVMHPYLIGRDLVTGNGNPTRFVIDLSRCDVLAAQAYPRVFQHIEQIVLPDRTRKAEEDIDQNGNVRPHHRQFLNRWWTLSWDRADMLTAFQRLDGRFIACSRVTKRPIFVFVDTTIRPADALQTFMFDDDYSFSILQSSVHWQWFITKCAKLNERPTYGPASIFDTFPWPQSPDASAVRAVAKAGCEVRRVRGEAIQKIKGGLRAMYRTLELPGKSALKDAHADLDAAVLKAYGFSARKDLLKQLLDLNLEVATRIKKNESVTAPGIPADYPRPEQLVTDDCIVG